MDIIEILLDNYEVPEFAYNGYEIAGISATSASGDIIEDPFYILLNNANNAFSISGESLIVNDYSKITTVLSDTKEISITVSGSTYTENILLNVSTKLCETSATSAATCIDCSTSGSILSNCEAGFGYFDPLSDCYAGENELYQSLVEESYNTAPVPSVFYVISYDTDFDKVTGENPSVTIVRKFNFNGYCEELPNDTVMYSNGFGGVQGLDQFRLYVSKKHFAKQSQKDYLDNALVYPEYIPRGGEYVLLKFNNKYYEITRVKDTDEMNYQRNNTWTFFMKVYEDDHAVFIPSTSASMEVDIMKVVDMDDIFNISDVIDEEKEDILYKPEIDEEEPQDPFVGWN